MKKVMALLFILLSSGFLSAESIASTVEGKSFWSDPIHDPMMPLFAISGLMIVVIALIMAVVISMIRVLNMFSEKAAEERAERLGIAYKVQPSWWNRMWNSMNATVPLDEEKNIELDHNFDGIKELDNHLPPWWKWLFYGTIAWSIVYIIIFHFTDSLPLSDEEYQNEVAMASEQRRQFIAAQPKAQIDESTLTYSNDKAIIQKGKDLYLINCSPCHKDNGGGGIGPNLTDDYWLHGGDVKDIYATIKNGVPEKGMVSWASVMGPEQIRNVTFFVMSIHGSNPSGAKAAQGELFKDARPEVEADTVKAQASL
jgi:cytochrome c oxidase cbb3-type subunit III